MRNPPMRNPPMRNPPMRNPPMRNPPLSAAEALFFTPNPCIERTMRVAGFACGASHRVGARELRVTAGGKGINAARVARNFGANARVLAPVGRGQIAQLRALMRDDELPADFVEVEADTRNAINIVHPGGFTELVEAGNPLTIRDGDAILERFGAHLQSCEMAVIGGSYQPFGTVSYWENHAVTLCQMAARARVKLLYDGKGVPFARALQSAPLPWAIKPNLAEASELLNRDLTAPGAQQEAVRELMARGIAVVLLSCGARGCWLGYDENVQWIAAPAIAEVSPVGSGDALVGAFVAHYLQSGEIYQSARRGVAAGSANAAQLEAARIGRRETELILDKMDKI